jgi:alpha-L-rhamnosidase
MSQFRKIISSLNPSAQVGQALKGAFANCLLSGTPPLGDWGVMKGFTELKLHFTRKYQLTFILLSYIFSLHAQEAAIVKFSGGSVSKYWGVSEKNLAPDNWQALWIWKKGESSGKNLSLIARKRFVLDSSPEKAKIFITADNIYELYINGTLVNRGPVRSHPRYQSYDVLELSSLLKTGENVMVIRALHHGSYGTFNLPPRPGLLVQLEIQNGQKRETIISDSSFKIKRYDAFNLSSENYSELVDLRKIDKGWQTIDFDDSKWENAEELVSDKFLGWPGPSPKSKPQTMISPWFELLPRDMPYLQESIARPVKVYESGEILELGFGSPVSSGLNNLLFPLKYCTVSDIALFEKGSGPLTVKNSYPSSLYSNDAIYSTYLIMDMGKLLHGFPQLEIEGEPGTIVELLYAPHLLRGKFPLRTMHQGRPAHRPAADKIILDKGKNTWTSLELKYMRYLFIAIRNTDKPVRLNFAGMITADYPFEARGSFSVKNDEEINWLWNAARNTLDAITTDAFTDNYRERLQYSQTSFYAARSSYAAYGDAHLQRRYLMQVALEQQSDGILPASAPLLTHRGQRFLDASIFWLLGLHDYYLHSGDEKTTLELLPKAELILDRFRVWENEDGFIDTPPYTYWIDHANIERFGANFSLNALYLLCMQDLMELNSWLGKTAEAAEYEVRVKKLKESMSVKFWDEKEKLFRDNLLDGSLEGKYTEHSNSLAIVAGIASPDQEKEIVREFTENKSSRLVHSVLFMHYIVEALLKQVRVRLPLLL